MVPSSLRLPGAIHEYPAYCPRRSPRPFDMLCYQYLWINMKGIHLGQLLLYFFCLQVFVSAAYADLFAPSAWREPAFKDSLPTRISVAHAAMDQIVLNFTLPSGIRGMEAFDAAPVISSITMADLAAGTFKYQGAITSLLSQIATNTNGDNLLSQGNTAYNDLALTWGIACVYAYRAYKVQHLLDLAVQVWDYVFTTYYVNEAQALNGTHPKRKQSFASVCNGHTTAGAVFLISNAANSSDTWVAPKTSGQFAALSALLAELTNNATYLKPALTSAAFLQNLLTDSSGLIYSSIDIKACAINQGPESLDTGIAMQAWSVVADASKDFQWTQAAPHTLVAATQTLSWTASDGVVGLSPGEDSIRDRAGSYKGTYMGSFYEPWARNAENATLRAYIEAYVAVQYNALQELAAVNGSSFYNDDWHGPAIDYWTRPGVTASTTLLAMALAPGADAPPSPTTSGALAQTTSPVSQISTSSAAPIAHHISPAAIAGSAIGALVVVIVLILGLLFFLRRRSQSNPNAADWETKIPVGDETEQGFSREPPPNRLKMPFRDPVAPLPVVSYAEAPLAPGVEPNGEEPMVSDIVERVYQRLQAERPTYDEVTEAPLPIYAPNQATRMRRDAQ